MSYIGVKLFTTTCLNIFVGFIIQNNFFMANQSQIKKMMEEQQKKAIVLAIK